MKQRPRSTPFEKRIFAIIMAVVVVLSITDSRAGTVTLSCTLPTQNTDGTPLTDLAGVRFYESLSSGGPYDLISSEIDCALVIDRPAGDHYFVATAFNLAGVESEYSNEAMKTVPAGIPSPPTELVADGDLLAYAVSQTVDVIVAYPVGRIPAGTPCDSTMRFNDKYVVPRASVEWVGTARPQVVFAECGGA